MRRVSFLILTAAILAGTASTVQVQSRNFYVRAGASGAGNGSDWANAYPALPATLQRGAIYYVAEGTYPRYTFDDAESGTALITVRKATPSGPHTSVSGWSAAYGDGRAIFTDGVKFTRGYYLIDGVNGGGPADWNCTNCGFQFRGVSPGVKLVHFDNANNITVQHVDMPHRGRFGNLDADDIVYAAVGGCENISVRYSYLHDSGRAPVLTRACLSFLFEYNKVARNESSPDQHAQGWSGVDRGRHVIRYNLFEDLEGTSMLTFGSDAGCTDGLEIYGNIFWARPPLVLGWGNGVIGSWTGTCTSNWKIYNNTFVNLTGADWRGPKIYLPGGTGHRVQNNTWVNNSTVSHQLGSGYILSHNSYYNTVIGGPTGIEDKVGLTGDPLVDWRNENFALRAPTHPGVAITTAVSDMLGFSRGADGIWDRGAFEHNGSTTVPPPPAAPTNLRIIR